MHSKNLAEHWTFLTNHARVLICIGRSPDVRVRDIAARVGITERQVLAIISALETSGYLSRERLGRRNHYRIHGDAHFRHVFEGTVTVGALVSLFSTHSTERAQHPSLVAWRSNL